MKKLNQKKSLLFLASLALVSVFQSCSKDDSSLVPEQESINDQEKVIYRYNGEIYTEKQLNNDALMNTYQVFDMDNQTISLFDNLEDSEDYTNAITSEFEKEFNINDFQNLSTNEQFAKNNTNSCNNILKKPCGQPFYSFSVTLFERKNFKGKSITFIRKDVNGNKKRVVHINIPKRWKNRASSLKAFQGRFAEVLGGPPGNVDCNKSVGTLHLFDKKDPDNKVCRSTVFRQIGTPSLSNPMAGGPFLKIKDLSKVRLNPISDPGNNVFEDINNKMDFIKMYFGTVF